MIRYSAEWWREYRLNHLEKLREYKRAYDSRRYHEHSDSEISRRVKWKLANKDKVECHRKLHYALLKGKLNKQPCEICHSEFSIAHHDDYTKPLEVRWLCEVHHKEYHKSLKDKVKPVYKTRKIISCKTA